jgi:hypothetical protein
VSEDPEAKFGQAKVSIGPFDHPDAEDHYANMTGVGITRSEVVLVFGQIFPEAIRSVDGGPFRLTPRLRVTLPVAGAQNLLSQLTQQLGVQEKLEDELRRKESGDAADSDSA